MSFIRDRSRQTEHAARGLLTARETLTAHYRTVRRQSEALCRPLEPDDYGLQAMPETSPLKWHLAHTTWFFETFLLKPYRSGYRAFNPHYEYLFNSYYNQVGAQFPRARRGLLSRPTVEEVDGYRAHVDTAMAALLVDADETQWPEIAARTTLGCQHEEQHQELFLTDIKYNLSVNPLNPAYYNDLPSTPRGAGGAFSWIEAARRHPGNRPRWRGFCVRQRGSTSSCAAAGLRAGFAARDQRRIPGVHRGGRLSASGVLACGRLARCPGVRLAGTALLAKGEPRAGGSTHSPASGR